MTNFNNPSWVGNSMFMQHIYNYWILIQWLISTVKRDKKVAIKQGNLICAVLIDLVLGYIILQLLPQNKNVISSTLMGVLERLIHLLYTLLKWLMGAPVGLKLNNAFNKMLGKYFSYHVQLWWLFLDVSGEKLDLILDIYKYIGYLGFTFQTALVADLICIATFHSYCIYVYAARLFNIQISGLIALMRLFVGRKYNPLRGGIDSCEYTNQELFVGTVAFTILLLLLPTTALYYIVFTGFRVLSLVVQYVLAKLIYLVQTSPLYVIFLWLTQSPKVRGNILMEVVNDEEDSPLVLKLKLFNRSIPELVNLFQPPVDISKHVKWTDLLSNMLVGKQIV
ncbi:phosphatidylinositol glycan anchor biosynthesis class Q isoform X2 [Anticarsia gemmatalis]